MTREQETRLRQHSVTYTAKPLAFQDTQAPALAGCTWRSWHTCRLENIGSSHRHHEEF